MRKKRGILMGQKILWRHDKLMQCRNLNEIMEWIKDFHGKTNEIWVSSTLCLIVLKLMSYFCLKKISWLHKILRIKEINYRFYKNSLYCLTLFCKSKIISKRAYLLKRNCILILEDCIVGIMLTQISRNSLNSLLQFLLILPIKD